ncbi:hypothetical protein [Cerasicoccus fimbriatus]|uniref:hypothetical protein n=1 Tax=Cerasicoccus fimbriatus TaxID=3014554 RepID=UPI003CCDB586
MKDLDFDRGQVTVRGGKGDEDRVSVLPQFWAMPCKTRLSGCAPCMCRTWRRGSPGPACRRLWRGSIARLGRS